MREGFIEIVAFNAASGRDLPEEEIGGKQYVVAEPGTEYAVRVSIHRLADGSWPFPYIRVGLFVDSIDVQYWKRLDLTGPDMDKATSVAASFWGFKKNNQDLNAFVFSNPTVATFKSSSAIVKATEVGQIRAIVHEAVVGDGIFQNTSGAYEIPTVASAIVEGKKFWQQASLSTAAGRSVSQKEKFSPLLKWANKNFDPEFEVTLNYHTSDMLGFIAEFLPNAESSSLQETRRNYVRLPSAKRHRSDGSAEAVIDLTTDSDNENGNSHENDEDEDRADSNREDEEVAILPKQAKEIPLLDLAVDDGDDSAQNWSSIIL